MTVERFDLGPALQPALPSEAALCFARATVPAKKVIDPILVVRQRVHVAAVRERPLTRRATRCA
jgi:hypothetical protein